MKLRDEALQALDTQLSILNHYKSETGQKYMVGFVADMVEKDRLYVPPEDDPNEYALNTGLRIAQETADALLHASTYYVTPDMMLLNEHAGATVPNTPFTEEELPTPEGFVVLPRPIITLDVHGHRSGARAFAWWKTTIMMKSEKKPGEVFHVPCLLYALFTNKNDMDDYYNADMYMNHRESWLQMPTWSMVHWQFIQFHDSWGEHELGGIRSQMKVDASPSTEEIPANQMFTWMAFLKAFFQLVKQEIAVREPQSIDRARYRRLRGSGMMPEYGDLQIVTLRRTRPRNENDEGVGSEVEWSHRWIVGSFWRKKPYHPSCPDCGRLGHGCGHHEPVWIEAFEKGPLNKPLIVKDKVFVWKR